MKLMAKVCTLVFACLLLFCSQHVFAATGDQTRQSVFEDGMTAYSRGDYRAAIEKFESLAADGLSAPLLYNLANSYAQAGQTGKAILNYERALRLAPGDSDTQGNLEHIRKEKGLFQEERSFLQGFVTLLSLNQWVAVNTVFMTFFAAILLLPSGVPLKSSFRRGLAFLFCILTVTTFAGVVGQYQHWYDGVVVAGDARLRVSPFATAVPIGSIQEGRLLRPGKEHNGFVLVVDESGRKGWLSVDAFEPIAIP